MFAGTPSLRRERAELNRLAWAFAISLAFHIFLCGSYYAGREFVAWSRVHHPAWLDSVKVLAELLKKEEPAPLTPQEPPLLFVETSLAQAVAEPPNKTAFYSDKNTLAANPDTRKDTDIPRITGEQTKIVKTEDVPKETFSALKPVAPVPTAKEEQEEIKARPTFAPGDITLGKAEPKPRMGDGDAPQPRPRTIKEALARLPENRLVGQKMKQEGGVKRRLEISSLDAKATPAGTYDYAFIRAVQSRWYGLLEDRDYASDSRGKVVLQFHLHSDGRVTELKVAENTAGEVLGLICEKAIMDNVPYEKWSKEMRLNLDDPRSIQFTFYYD